MKIWAISLLTTLFVFCLLCQFAYAVSWVQVTQFSGSASETTDYFTVSHAEWRVDWTYTPDPTYPQYASFYLDIYNQNQSEWPASIDQLGNTTTNGTTYVHNLSGTFYCDISVSSVTGYTITIEQDVNSVPEYPAFFLILALLTVLFITFAAFRKRSKSLTSLRISWRECRVETPNIRLNSTLCYSWLRLSWSNRFIIIF